MFLPAVLASDSSKGEKFGQDYKELEVLDGDSRPQ